MNSYGFQLAIISPSTVSFVLLLRQFFPFLKCPTWPYMTLSACPDLFRALRCARFPTPVPPAIGTPCGKIGKTPTIRTNTYIAAPEVETTEIKCARVKWVKLMTRFKSLDGFKSITPNRFELK